MYAFFNNINSIYPYFDYTEQSVNDLGEERFEPRGMVSADSACLGYVCPVAYAQECALDKDGGRPASGGMLVRRVVGPAWARCGSVSQRIMSESTSHVVRVYLYIYTCRGPVHNAYAKVYFAEAFHK